MVYVLEGEGEGEGEGRMATWEDLI